MWVGSMVIRCQPAGQRASPSHPRSMAR
jgi:hypothetical protein